MCLPRIQKCFCTEHWLRNFAPILTLISNPTSEEDTAFLKLSLLEHDDCFLSRCRKALCRRRSLQRWACSRCLPQLRQPRIHLGTHCEGCLESSLAQPTQVDTDSLITTKSRCCEEIAIKIICCVGHIRNLKRNSRARYQSFAGDYVSRIIRPNNPSAAPTQVDTDS